MNYKMQLARLNIYVNLIYIISYINLSDNNLKESANITEINVVRFDSGLKTV